MSNEITVREWTNVIRRARFGRRQALVRAVALLLASYADSDGTRCFPGIARLAVDLEADHKGIETALAKLRAAGLIERVRRGSGRTVRRGDEYRLVLAEDILDRDLDAGGVEILSPNAYERQVQELKQKRQGTYREPDLRPTERGAVQPEPPMDAALLRPVERGADPISTLVDNATLRPTERGADAPGATSSAPRSTGPIESSAPRSDPICAPFNGSPPSTTSATTQTEPNWLSPTVTPPTRETDLVEAEHPDSSLALATVVDDPSENTAALADPPSDRCDHGFRRQRRADGSPTCVFCRRQSRHLHAV